MLTLYGKVVPEATAARLLRFLWSCGPAEMCTAIPKRISVRFSFCLVLSSHLEYRYRRLNESYEQIRLQYIGTNTMAFVGGYVPYCMDGGPFLDEFVGYEPDFFTIRRAKMCFRIHL